MSYAIPTEFCLDPLRTENPFCPCCGIQAWDEEFEIGGTSHECQCPEFDWCDVCGKCVNGCTCLDIEDFADDARNWMRRPKYQRELFAAEVK